MSEDNNITVKASYDKFVRSFTKYANPNKPIKDLATIRSEIQDILKTHRPIRFVDYQFGISKSLKQRSQIIVHEFNEHSKVREYFKAGSNVWKCCECNRTTSNESDTSDLIFAHGMVFVKNGHDCKPRDFSFVQEIQKLYKEKNIDEAVALQKSVLGSEDLNIVCKQKTAASRKCATKIAAKGTLSELNLQSPHARQFLFMDESVDTIQEILSPEDAFKEIIGNLKEYTSQGLEDVMVNKTRILRFLKTYHPVKIDNYVFGLSENLRTDKRLIVFEWNDRKRVREYTKKPGKNNHWVCRECFRQYERGVVKIQHYLFLYSGIVLVHNTAICKPISYELVMQYQKFLAEGNVKLAQSMIHSVSFLYEKCNFANIVNVLDTLSTKRKEVNGNENNSKVFCETIDVEMKEVEPVSIQTTSIFAFEKPSTSMLKEICAKLKIEYSSRAEKMWEQIMFKRIDTVTPPKQILIHHLKTQNFYQILSKFFIGKTKQHKQIKAALINAFPDKLISSGEASSKKFDKLYSDTVTAEHLSFIAKYLSCRILIFEGAEMRKYGNWKNTSSKRATLVVALIDGFYSIVLDF